MKDKPDNYNITWDSVWQQALKEYHKRGDVLSVKKNVIFVKF